MKLDKISKPMMIFMLIGLMGINVHGHASEAEKNLMEMIHFYGDFRFRFEEDWDSTRSDSSERSDRARARIRGRIGLKITPNEFFEINTRLRTGNQNNQQSPHWTIADFSNNSTGTHALVFDKWYGKLKKDHLWAWGGAVVTDCRSGNRMSCYGMTMSL